jgi:hypothetical protein
MTDYRRIIDALAMETRLHLRQNDALAAVESLLCAFEALEEYVLPDEESGTSKKWEGLK